MHEDVAKTYTKDFNRPGNQDQQGTGGQVPGGDAGVYVNMETSTRTTASRSRRRRKARQALSRWGCRSGEVSEKAIEMFTKLIGPLFQAVEDMHGVLATLEFRPGGLALHLETRCKPEALRPRTSSGSSARRLQGTGKNAEGPTSLRRHEAQRLVVQEIGQCIFRAAERATPSRKRP